MARGPHRAEGGVGLARVERCDRGQARARGKHGRGPRLARSHGRGWLELTAAGDAEALHRVEVQAGVHPGKVLPGRGRGNVPPDRVYEIGLAHSRNDRLKALGTLGMAPACVMAGEGLMGQEEDASAHRMQSAPVSALTSAPSVRTAGSEVIAWGAERARAAPWRGEADVAALTPMPDAPVPTAAFVRRCLAELTSRGYRRVVTSALSPAEQLGFLAAGFTVSEQLHLLSHDLNRIAEPDAPGVRLTRASDRMDSEVLALDAQAFEPFWRLDSRSLRDAIKATPSARFRVARAARRDGGLVGYAVTGRAGRRGYVQRLAVAPDRQRQGIGTALVIDGLRWLRRRRAREALVNTQIGNDAALHLYESLGFRRQPAGLSVLEIYL